MTSVLNNNNNNIAAIVIDRTKLINNKCVLCRPIIIPDKLSEVRITSWPKVSKGNEIRTTETLES